MTWVPSTRGTTSKKVYCAYTRCMELNTNLNYYTRDCDATRWLCNEHWVTITGFFITVKNCSHCYRYCLADLYAAARTQDTVKFSDKWWELCLWHRQAYFDSMDIILVDED